MICLKFIILLIQHQKYESRGRDGSRFIVHMEAYILNIVKILNI